MKVTIDISDEEYKWIKEHSDGVTDYSITLKLYSAVKNGTVNEEKS